MKVGLVVSPATSPESADFVIGDKISNTVDQSETSPRLASRELQDVRNTLDTQMGKVMPDFGNYRQTYSDMSKPVDQQSYLQGLNITNADGSITKSKVDNAIKSIETRLAQRGTNQAKSIDPVDLQTLYNIREDLRRKDAIYAGKAIGSPTVQNLATNAVVQKLGFPIASAIAASQSPWLAGAAWLGKNALAGKQNDLLSLMANKLMDPTALQSPSFLRATQPRRFPNLTASPVTLPAASIATRNLLAPTQGGGPP